MSKIFRHALTIVFSGLFLAIAPVLVLYSAGYRYHPLKHRIEKTGIIRVETIPTDARVWLNGVPQNRSTPAAFARLLPEDYEVRIEKKGYLPWVDEMEVRSGETAFAVGVRLIKDALPRLVAPGSATTAAWHDGTERTAFVRRGDGGTQEIFSRDAQGTETLVAKFAPGTYERISLSYSPNGRSVLATAVREDDAAHLYVLGMDAGRSTSRSLHDAFLPGRLTAHWSDDETIAVTARDGAFAARTDGTVSQIASGRHYRDAIADGRAWYAIVDNASGADHLVQRIDGDSPTTLTSLPMGDWTFVDGSWPLIMADAHRSRIAFVSGGPGTVPTLFDASHAERSRDGRTILLWNDFEISTYDIALGERATVTRIGTTILAATRLADGAVAFSTPGGIALLQPTKEGYRDAIDLVRFTDIGPFHVPANGSTVQFFGTVGNMTGSYSRDL